jgi:DNA repair protein RadC
MRYAKLARNEKFHDAVRFAELIADAADETKIIDLILSVATSDQYPKGLADRLIEKFGSYPGVIAAPIEELVELEGVGESGVFLFKLIKAAAQRAVKPDFKKAIKLGEISDVLAYLQSLMRYETREKVRVIFLNTKNQVIDQRVMFEGTLSHVPIFIRDIVRLALALNAAGLILVHNHTSGDPTPSEVDLSETLRLREACDLFDIQIHDHLIIGNGSWSSLKTLGYL